MANGCRVLCYVARSDGLIVVVTRPLTKDRGMEEDHGAPKAGQLSRTWTINCTNQQPPQRGGAVPGPVWVGSKWLLAFPRVPVTPGTSLHFFAMLPTERPQKGSTQLFLNWSPIFSLLLSFSFLCLLILLLL